MLAGSPDTAEAATPYAQKDSSPWPPVASHDYNLMASNS